MAARASAHHRPALPPYSPELNPCEQMWDIVKDDTCNQVFANVAALRDRMRETLQRYWEDAQSVLQRIGRDWIMVQLNATRKSPLSAQFKQMALKCEN